MIWLVWWAEYWRALAEGPHTLRTGLLRHHVGYLRLAYDKDAA